MVGQKGELIPIVLFIEIVTKSFAGGMAVLLKAFFDGLFGPSATVARPLFAAFVEKVGRRGCGLVFSKAPGVLSKRLGRPLSTSTTSTTCGER